MKHSFRGGIHVNEHKNTEKCAVTRIPAPSRVYIPLSQHIGAPCTPAVKVGDTVLRGQLIGEPGAGLGCPVHSSVSGTVVEFRTRHNAMGNIVTDVVIDNDGKDTPADNLRPSDTPPEEWTTEKIIAAVRDAGIAGMGGASFPTHAKIASALGKVDTLLINCAECEPYITANHRLLLEDPMTVLRGTRLLVRALGLSSGTLVVEDNKQDAIDLLEITCAASFPELKVSVVKTKYPQGDERQLIYAVTRRELPSGKLPADIGCVVFNAETAAAVYRAVTGGMPLIQRIVTVDGDCVKEPKNLLVPIGTTFRDLIDACGGLVKTPKLLISGGPMMGFTQWNPDEPVTKGTSAILAMSEEANKPYLGEHECIRCGRCVAACPMHLMPNYIAAYTKQDDYDSAKDYGAMSCVECGSCSYICPAEVPIVQYVRRAKAVLRQKK
ncbi:MAG: electron transport complex subunit RsxC [Clostridia bacterium]|nr:electron transport complex subunit RsxC [Clostridia bacterium]